MWLEPEPAWLKECGFAEEIHRIKFRVQVRGYHHDVLVG